ncbi:uncharacterized protein LOC100501214 [Zea mays]|uniref:uncharacterized protein LOC100501214 n=1 Tax=Zea mays TaxID=4577 RepID=UPI0001BA9118|nr:uncharacterized protein LOC100501214 [Zea mays]|eukprot:NP_001344583.1 uncharacterized protein LOC100501214 [Zea mays]
MRPHQAPAVAERPREVAIPRPRRARVARAPGLSCARDSRRLRRAADRSHCSSPSHCVERRQGGGRGRAWQTSHGRVGADIAGSLHVLCSMPESSATPEHWACSAIPPPPSPKRPTQRPDRGPLGPPIGGGRRGHPIWAMACEDDASTRSIDGTRGLSTTGSNGPDDHRHWWRWRMTSNCCCSGRRRWWCCQIDIHRGRCRRSRVKHRRRWRRGCSGESTLHHRQRNHRCPSMENAEVHILHLHTAFRDLVHRWECSGLPNGERFQHCIINNMKNFAHTAYAYGNVLSGNQWRDKSK